MLKKFNEYILNSILENRRNRFSISNVFDTNDFIVEGIEIDLNTRKVKLNDSNKGIDFEGPIYWKENGMDIISIFKHTKLKEFKHDRDGNPFIYALKNKYDWKFDVSYQDIKKIS